jgi:hypothetical protein
VKISQSFSHHLNTRTFVTPGSKYSPGHLVNSIDKLARYFRGESEHNIGKLKCFVVKSDQALIVSSYERGYKAGVVPWALSDNFLKLLDRSIDYVSWAKDIHNDYFQGHSNFSSAYKFFKKDQYPYYRHKIKAARREEKSIRCEISRSLKGGDPSLTHLREELDYVSCERKFWTSCISAISREFANVACVKGVKGKTYSCGNFVTIRDTCEFSPKDDDPLSVRDTIRRIIHLREHGEGFLSSEQKELTFSFSTAKENSQYDPVITYIHEVGHQIHFKSHSEPPKSSVSLARDTLKGITKYSSYSYDEAFAEAFVAYVLNPEALVEYDRPLYDWVDATVNAALKLC